jgi:class 3 adenylate cyclase
MERRLTTILATDVVGYSRLMGEDEAGTLAALKKHRRELLEPKAAQGRAVSRTLRQESRRLVAISPTAP